MEDSEKNRYIEFLIQQKEDRDKTIADKDAFIKNLQESLEMLKSMHESDSKKIDEMLAKINDLTAQLKFMNKQTYAEKSQMGVSGKGRSKTPAMPLATEWDARTAHDYLSSQRCLIIIK
jgi:peptidoglycan hydrolase CwlO-like protein